MKNFKLYIVGGLLILLVLVGALSISYVPVNSVGVKYNRLSGTIKNEPVSSGIKFKVPLAEKITSVSTELRSADVDEIPVTSSDAQAEANANKKISEGITKELIDYLEAEARKEHGWYKYNNMNPVITESEE